MNRNKNSIWFLILKEAFQRIILYPCKKWMVFEKSQRSVEKQVGAYMHINTSRLRKLGKLWTYSTEKLAHSGCFRVLGYCSLLCWLIHSFVWANPKLQMSFTIWAHCVQNSFEVWSYLECTTKSTCPSWQHRADSLGFKTNLAKLNSSINQPFRVETVWEIKYVIGDSWD